MFFVISRSVSRFDKQPCACLQSKLVTQNYELGQSSCLAVPGPSLGLSATWTSPHTDVCAAGLKQSWRLVRETSMDQWGMEVLRLKPLIALSHRDFYWPAWNEPSPVPWQHLSCPGLILGTLGWDTGNFQRHDEIWRPGSASESSRGCLCHLGSLWSRLLKRRGTK